MRILVLADIHGNFEALKAVNETFDALLFLGDVVDYGPDPASCIDWIRGKALKCVRGNHDHAVATGLECGCSTKLKDLSVSTRRFTSNAITADHKAFLSSMPPRETVELDGLKIYMVHAVPSDPYYKYALTVDEWREEIADVDANIILAGHTHMPFLMRVDEKLVINPGSVGQPRDGDPRLSYAIIEDKHIILKRKEYDISKTVAGFKDMGLSTDEEKKLDMILHGKMP